jgi:ribosomal protein S18 acetylase RimI-like enzyme
MENINFLFDKNKFKVLVNNKVVSYCYFTIEPPDEYQKENYVTLYSLRTFKKFQRQGFAKYLLNSIFEYTKNNLGINIVMLNVYKDTYKAVNLYFNIGFEIFIEYKDSYSLLYKGK